MEMHALLTHAEWVRRVARDLVRDPHTAEDLAQDTMLRAIQNAPERIRSPRHWLGRILRNVVRERYRRDMRRQSREQVAASRAEDAPSSDELAFRVDAHRQVVEELMAMRGIYRDVLLRRYYEGETPTEIAAHMGLPIPTVKTRLQRGLAAMRERLDRRNGGDRGAWVVMLVSLCRVPPKSVQPANATITYGAGVVMAIACVGLGLSYDAASPPPRSESRVARGRLPLEEIEDRDSLTQRDVVGVRSSGGESPTRAVALDLRGRVQFLDGTPASRVRLALRSPESREDDLSFESAIDGMFAYASSGRPGMLCADDSDVVTVFATLVRDPASRSGAQVVVARSGTVEGRVVDDIGRGLPNVEVEVLPPRGARALLGLSSGARFGYDTRTDADGVFRIDSAPIANGVRIRARRGGWRTCEVECDGSQERRVLEMSPALPSADSIVGVVRDAHGGPLTDVRIGSGLNVTHSDASGRFMLEPGFTNSGRAATRLVAAHPGYGPLVIDATAHTSGTPRWPDPLELRMAAETRSIDGRITDRGGAPRADVVVWLADPSVVFAAPGSQESMLTPFPELAAPAGPEIAEWSRECETHRDFWHRVRTDARGRFEFEGLGDRVYRVAALDPATGFWCEVGEVHAGTTGCELTFEPRTREEESVVVVRDGAGRAVAGATVSIATFPFRITVAGEIVQLREELREIGDTDADGRIVVPDLPVCESWIKVMGHGLTKVYSPVDPSVHEHEVRVTRSADLRVRVIGDVAGDSISVQDSEREDTLVLIRRGATATRTERVALDSDVSPILRVSDAATDVVLWRGDLEIARYPVALEPGSVTEVVVR